MSFYLESFLVLLFAIGSIISVGVVMADRLQPPPYFGRNLLHSGNFSDRKIGDSGKFSDFALLIRAETLQPPKFLVLLRLWEALPPGGNSLLPPGSASDLYIPGVFPGVILHEYV